MTYTPKPDMRLSILSMGETSLRTLRASRQLQVDKAKQDLDSAQVRYDRLCAALRVVSDEVERRGL